MGGSDQWGNIVNGIELTRRKDGVQVYGVTTPLITTADGGKMGKTMQGAVWLNAEMLSPYDYWQYWRNTEDADVGRAVLRRGEAPLPGLDRVLQRAPPEEAAPGRADPEALDPGAPQAGAPFTWAR